ncbi:hypothetical protein [Ralstonia pseudosolanacearum]|nr:hypothetical protein [Ralstonia pseudosolanacearum]
MMIIKLAKVLENRFKGSKRLSVSPSIKLLAVYLLAMPLTGTYLLFAIPTAFVSVMIFPVELGVLAAKSVAADDITDFKRGCAAHARGKRCFELRDGKETVATGFIIEQSKDLIAIFDNGLVKLLPMEKKSLVSVDSLP